MRILSVILLVAAFLFAGCSEEPAPTEADEVISQPRVPAGPDTAFCDELVVYSSGGAVSSVGHALEYQFDCDAQRNHQYIGWGDTTNISHSWPDSGSYLVNAQARCREHKDIKSPWSEGKNVRVLLAPMPKPAKPTGPAEIEPDSSATYCTSSITSDDGDLIEYRFDFGTEGGGAFTPWDTTLCISHSWQRAGCYVVRVQARSATHNDQFSSWSEGLIVTVLSDFVSTPRTPTGPEQTDIDTLEDFCTGGASSSKGDPVEYRFDFDAEGDSDTTTWDGELCISHSWSSSGTFVVKAQARSTVNTQRVSSWSDGKIVMVTLETISIPDPPMGADVSPYFYPSFMETYCTGGANSSKGHPIEYRFEDEDPKGNLAVTAWDTTTCLEFPWRPVIYGSHVLRAQARCSIHTSEVSSWSDGKTVQVITAAPYPIIRFTTSITRVINGNRVQVTKPYNPSVLDTVGMFRPFSISYHGIPARSPIRAYRFFPLTADIVLEGQDVWTKDLSDTVRFFPNVDDPLIPNGQSLDSGIFRLAAQCKDDSGRVSMVDVLTFQYGVAQVLVNHDPETTTDRVLNTYFIRGQEFTEYVNLADDVPDTIPYNSWIRLEYNGWDSPYDSSLCQDALNKCLTYQIRYDGFSDRFEYVNFRSGWLPYGSGLDTNPFGTNDSTTMNIGTIEYRVWVRTIDEYGRPDGTLTPVELVGNFDPTLDGFQLKNHTGETVEECGTLLWDWWNPVNTDTIDLTNSLRKKVFYFIISATGHDHPKDPDGSGVKTWFYLFKTAEDPPIVQTFARSGSWVEGSSINVLSDTFRVVFTYPLADTLGNTVFNNLPEWLNHSYDFSIKGRDTGRGDEFSQYFVLDGEILLENNYSVASIGRWTHEGKMRFYFKIRR